MNKYRCLNKDCKYYYWLCFFPAGEPEGSIDCHGCNQKHFLIPEEKPVELNFGYLKEE
jgi:hypothetical protein